jgi:hypothetical protein
MTCAKCGSTLPEGTRSCSVCNPWAVPATVGAPGPAVLAGAPKAAGPIPKWIKGLAKRNPPAQADLDKAWRNTVIVCAATTFFCLCVAVALLIESRQNSPELLSLARLLTWIPMAAFGVCMLVFRNKTWLGRAIAVVGSRPDIGYAGFARLPGIARITAMSKWNLGAFSAIALFLLAVYLDHGLSTGDRRSAWAVAFLVLVPVSLSPLFWQAAARRELRKLLAA